MKDYLGAMQTTFGGAGAAITRGLKDGQARRDVLDAKNRRRQALSDLMNLDKVGGQAFQSELDTLSFDSSGLTEEEEAELAQLNIDIKQLESQLGNTATPLNSLTGGMQ